MPCGLNGDLDCGVRPDTSHRPSAAWLDGETVDRHDDQYRDSPFIRSLNNWNGWRKARQEAIYRAKELHRVARYYCREGAHVLRGAGRYESDSDDEDEESGRTAVDK